MIIPKMVCRGWDVGGACQGPGVGNESLEESLMMIFVTVRSRHAHSSALEHETILELSAGLFDGWRVATLEACLGPSYREGMSRMVLCHIIDFLRIIITPRATIDARSALIPSLKSARGGISQLNQSQRYLSPAGIG